MPTLQGRLEDDASEGRGCEIEIFRRNGRGIQELVIASDSKADSFHYLLVNILLDT